MPDLSRPSPAILRARPAPRRAGHPRAHPTHRPAGRAPAPSAPGPLRSPLRIVVVHWRIVPGREAEFLRHWSEQARIADRSGLVSEFLSSPDDRAPLSGLAAAARDPRWSSFFNVGTWRDGAAFHAQVGRFIDDGRPLLPFEAARRERVLLVPERWRLGGGALPGRDQRDVR